MVCLHSFGLAACLWFFIPFLFSLFSLLERNVTNQPFKFITLGRFLSICYDINKITRQNKWYSFSIYAELHLKVAKEMSKIDMDKLNKRMKKYIGYKIWWWVLQSQHVLYSYLSSFFHHNVITMAITNTQYVRCNTVTSTRHGKCFNSTSQSKSIKNEAFGMDHYLW